MSEPVITYEELVMWRNICEWMAAHGGYAAAEQLIHQFGEAVTPLVSYDRARRQALWDAYLIQLVIWHKEGKYGCWQLKANWELKIDYLEKIVFGADPETTPRLYLDVLPKHQAERERKAHQKRRKACLKDIGASLRAVHYQLTDLGFYLSDDGIKLSPEFFRYYLQNLRAQIRQSRSLLQAWREKFDDRPQPEPGSVVLGGTLQRPQPTDAVLGGQRV